MPGFTVTRPLPQRWTVVFDNPPANLARAIAGFDRQVLGSAKALIDGATLPSTADLVAASNAFFESAARRAA